MDPRLCSMMLNPFASLFPFFYFISLSLCPCHAFSSLFTLFFTCFSVFSLPLLSSFWLVSFLWSPGELVGLVVLCTVAHLCFVTSADVAHHRPQHALNKPSNPKAPQGTSLSATLALLPYGCQPSSTHCQHSLRPLTATEL